MPFQLLLPAHGYLASSSWIGSQIANLSNVLGSHALRVVRVSGWNASKWSTTQLSHDIQIPSTEQKSMELKLSANFRYNYRPIDSGESQ